MRKLIKAAQNAISAHHCIPLWMGIPGLDMERVSFSNHPYFGIYIGDTWDILNPFGGKIDNQIVLDKFHFMEIGLFARKFVGLKSIQDEFYQLNMIYENESFENIKSVMDKFNCDGLSEERITSYLNEFVKEIVLLRLSLT